MLMDFVFYDKQIFKKKKFDENYKKIDQFYIQL